MFSISNFIDPLIRWFLQHATAQRNQSQLKFSAKSFFPVPIHSVHPMLFKPGPQGHTPDSRARLNLDCLLMVYQRKAGEEDAASVYAYTGRL